MRKKTKITRAITIALFIMIHKIINRIKIKIRRLREKYIKRSIIIRIQHSTFQIGTLNMEKSLRQTLGRSLAK